MDKIKVSKDDVREAFEFNRKGDAFKQGRTAYIRVFPNEKNAHVHYHERGNYYPSDVTKPVHIPPHVFFEHREAWMGYDELKNDLKIDKRVANKDEIDRAWKEVKEIFWSEVNWRDDLGNLPDDLSPRKRKKIDGLEVEYV